MLSVIIPARNERFLQQTVDDILAKARGKIEIIVLMDGPSQYPFDDRGEVMVLSHEKPIGLRACINHGVFAAEGKYIMKIDGHCMVDEGFDVKLAEDCEPNWIVIPRRKRLDAENWCIKDVGKVDVDYEYLSFPGDPNDWGGPGLHGKQWNERTKERLHIPIDENMSYQGSCWFMHKEYYKFLDLFDEANYGIFYNEAQESGLKCWLSGGRVMTNKKTWFAHLHKGKQYGRGYHIDKRELTRGNDFVNLWLSNATGWKKQTLPFSWLIEHFSPVPSWPENWKELYPLCTTLRS